MNVALLGESWWSEACEALGLDHVVVPLPPVAGTSPYARDLAARRSMGHAVMDQIGEADPDLILDNGAVGLAFRDDAASHGNLKLVHELLGVPYVSHIIDPVVTAFQLMSWDVVIQTLQSATWHKCLFDAPQAYELTSMGVPGVHRTPMAAINRDYDTTPLDPKAMQTPISFVGNQNTQFYSNQFRLPCAQLLAGTLVQAVRNDLPDVSYYDAYFNMYRLDEPIQPSDSLETRVRKSMRYFENKLCYNAARCVHQRDRFVLFLSKKLGNTFRLIGQRWDAAYGLPCEPPIPTTDAYLHHFRTCAINLNFANGNTDSGLNMRHFEITAAGGFMLCYHQPEIETCFDVGKECVTFRNERDLLEKIEYYLTHPAERVEIAMAGQRRTLREHLYSHRLADMLRVVQSPAASVSSQAGASDEMAMGSSKMLPVEVN